jgi:septum formation protein
MRGDRCVVLASASPRRRALLATFFPDLVVDVPLKEEGFKGGSPHGLVEALAQGKAREVASRHPQALIIGADTVVVVDGEILGKPGSRRDGVRMLKRLSGRWHEVVTGLALASGDKEVVSHAITQVLFAPLTPQEIGFYLATGEPLDKAGAYGIQGIGGLFVEEIKGSYTNVVGLPLRLLYVLMGELGLDIKSWIYVKGGER